jgi:Flp pilus assembly protein TadG
VKLGFLGRDVFTQQLGPLARKFAGERRSDTAVEFALIGSVLFLFVFGIFAVAVDQFWQMTLDDSVRNASRKVQFLGITSGPDFVTAVCNEFGVAAPLCGTTLQYSVQGATSYAGIVPQSLSAAGVLSGSGTFTGVTLTTPPSFTSSPVVAGSEQFLLVQVAYLLPFKILLAAKGTMTQNGTPTLYSAVAAVMQPSS